MILIFFKWNERNYIVKSLEFIKKLRQQGRDIEQNIRFRTPEWIKSHHFAVSMYLITLQSGKYLVIRRIRCSPLIPWKVLSLLLTDIRKMSRFNNTWVSLNTRRSKCLKASAALPLMYIDLLFQTAQRSKQWNIKADCRSKIDFSNNKN